MLIVLEGLDGAGKSTQVRMIRDYIQASGREVEYLHFPRFDSPLYGDLIARFLRGEFGSIENVHPQLVALLFAEDRHAAKSLLEGWLTSGKVVLLDRYVFSNVAFQCAKSASVREADALRKWILDTEYGLFALPVPDVNLFLDVPLDFVSERLKENRSGNDRDYLAGKEDIHESDMGFQMRVRNIYLKETELTPSFVKIGCMDACGLMLPENDIFSKIRLEIDKLL